MKWRRPLEHDPDEADPALHEALERLDELHERAEKVAHRLMRTRPQYVEDRFADEVAALFRGERP